MAKEQVYYYFHQLNNYHAYYYSINLLFTSEIKYIHYYYTLLIIKEIKYFIALSYFKKAM